MGTLGKSRNWVPRTCLFCEKTCPSHWYLEMHLNTHTNERPHQCRDCDANFKFTSGLHLHCTKVHPRERHACKICCKSFITPTRLVAHKKRHHMGRKLEQSTRKTTGISKGNGKLDSNRKSTNAIKVIMKAVARRITRNTFTTKMKLTSGNGRDLSTKFNLKAHFKTNNIKRKWRKQCGKKYSAAVNSIDNPRKAVHKGGRKPRTKICIFCDKSFSNQGNLQHHMNTHTKERPYQCFQCDASFSTPSSLREHRDSVHLKKKHKCRICHKLISGRSNLFFHMKKHYTGKRHTASNICVFCDKSFSSKRNLQIHLNTHTMERPYQCSQCSANFGTPAALTEHHNTVHLGKKYSCDICNKLVSGRSNWYVHMKAHLVKPGRNKPQVKSNLTKRRTTFEDSRKLECNGPLKTCVFCTKMFGTELELKMHVHPKNPPFHCCQCDAKFTFRSTLYVHRRNLHLGEKHSRGICSKSFSSDSKLMAHGKVHMEISSQSSCSQPQPDKTVQVLAGGENNEMEQNEIAVGQHRKSVRFADTVILIDSFGMEMAKPLKPCDILCVEEEMKSEHDENENHSLPPDSPSLLPMVTTDNVNDKIQSQQNIASFGQNSVENKDTSRNSLIGNNMDSRHIRQVPNFNDKFIPSMKTELESKFNDVIVNKIYLCPFCDERFSRKKHWKSHLGSTHRMSTLLALTKGSVLSRSGSFEARSKIFAHKLNVERTRFA